jgi:hypothetical protein
MWQELRAPSQGEVTEKAIFIAELKVQALQGV